MLELLPDAEQARQRAERVADRLAHLHTVAAALAEARDVEEVLRAAVENAITAAGAVAGLVYTVEAGDTAVLKYSRGYTSEQPASFVRLEMNEPIPLSVTLRSGEPQWIVSTDDLVTRYPALKAIVRSERRAWVTLPLALRGTVLGALGLSFGEERCFDEDERAFLGALAQQCALALDRAAAREAEHAVLLEARRSAERLSRLQQVTAAFSSSLTPEQVGRVIIEQLLPCVGASAGLLAILLPGGEAVEVLAISGYSEEVRQEWRRFSLHAPLPPAECIRTGQPILMPDADSIARRYPALFSSLGRGPHRALATIPVAVAGCVIGALGLSFLEEHEFAEDEVAFLLSLAQQCGQALERARLFVAELRAREEADAARAQAEAASRAKDEFLALLGHELRNPLAPIVTALHLMKMRAGGRMTREQEIIERQLRHVIRLVDDLLDVSRITRGKLELTRRSMELGPVISRAIEMAAPLIEQRQHRLSIEVPGAGLRVEVDEGRLAQVFANLLTNAARYTPPGGEIRVIAAREGAEVVVRVRDSGVGIEPELLPRIFDAFVQGLRMDGRSEGGLGLGLALVRNLVQLHGGRVEVRSEGRGHGAEFTVRLPALELAADPLMRGSSAAAARPLAKEALRILVVDDNLDAGALLADALRSDGHEIAMAVDGPEALQIAERFQPHLAVLDIGLPVMDGYELGHRLRALSGLGGLRLIAVTGYGREHDQERSREHGFERHFVKPVDLGALLATVQN